MVTFEEAEQVAENALAAEGHGDYSRAESLYRQADYLYREARDPGSAQEMRMKATTARVASMRRIS